MTGVPKCAKVRLSTHRNVEVAIGVTVLAPPCGGYPFKRSELLGATEL